MDTVGDIFTRGRRSEHTALVDETGREFDYHWLCTTSWKAGNFLRHTGIRRGVTVGIVGDGPLALLACFGTALLEGKTRFDPPGALADADDFRTLVAPVEALDRYELPPGAQRVGYGDQPDAPDVHHFDAGLWSENPSFPPVSIAPETPVLDDGERSYSHGAVVDAARAVADEFDVNEGTRVAVAGPLSDPRTVTAGIVAPLLVGGTVVLDDAADVEVVVGPAASVSAAGSAHCTLDAVALDPR